MELTILRQESKFTTLNSLANNKVVDQYELKVLVDGKTDVTRKFNFDLGKE